MLSPDDTQQLLQAGSARALADAAAYIRSRVSADGPADGAEGDFAAPEHQWAALREWASADKKILPLEFPGPERDGGREHDVRFHEPSGRWLQGNRVSLDHLSAAFVAAGFQLLPWRGLGYEGSLSLRFEGFDIWDVHPANVLLSPEGLPLPIDVIVTRSPAARS